MTAPIAVPNSGEIIAVVRTPTSAPYELYRVITDYEALQDGFLDRIDDLDTTLEQIDLAGDLAKGNAQKLLNKGNSVRGWDRTRRDKRILGWESLSKMLKGTGLALVLVVDDERFAPIKEQLGKRKRPRQQANASSAPAPWLFCKDKAREMGKKRWSGMTPEKRKKMMRKAGRASGRARRRKSASGALLAPAQSASSVHGQPSPVT